MSITPSQSVKDTGADSYDLLLGITPRNQGLMIRIREPQRCGAGGRITGGFDLLDCGSGFYSEHIRILRNHCRTFGSVDEFIDQLKSISGLSDFTHGLNANGLRKITDLEISENIEKSVDNRFISEGRINGHASEFVRLVKKLGKKHIRLLEILDRGTLEALGSLTHVFRLLLTHGLIEIENSECRLSEYGRSFVAFHQHSILLNTTSSTDELVNYLLPKTRNRTNRLTKRERLFLLFISHEARPIGEIRHAKKIIPSLATEGLVTIENEIVRITEIGINEVAKNSSQIDVQASIQLFLSQVKIDARLRKNQKVAECLELHSQGVTLEQIGQKFGVTRQRVEQLIKLSPRYPGYKEQLTKQKQESAEIQANEKKRNDRLRKLEKSLANRFPYEVDTLWDWQKNEDLDPTKIAAHSTSIEVWWRCPIDGHSWKRVPSQITGSWTRSRTSGCPLCAGRSKPPVKQPFLMQEYPQHVNRFWDWSRNSSDGSDPTRITLASNRSIWLRCDVHSHSWQTKVHSLVNQQWAKGKTGCRVCNGTQYRKQGAWGKADPLGVKFPEQVEIYWDHEANKQVGIDPQTITSGSSRKAFFVCPIDSYRWEASISAINNSWARGNSGCPACRGFATTPELSVQGLYPSFVAKMWDYEKNRALNLNPQELTPGSSASAHFICEVHDFAWSEQIKSITKSFWMTARNGCPVCHSRRRFLANGEGSGISYNADTEIPNVENSTLLGLMGYHGGLLGTREQRQNTLNLLYEVELSVAGELQWGVSKSATRRLKLIEELNLILETHKKSEDHKKVEDLENDINFVQISFF